MKKLQRLLEFFLALLPYALRVIARRNDEAI